MATFGKTTNGTAVQTFSGDRKYVSQGTPASSGTVTSGWGRVRLTSAGSTNSKMVIYSDTAGEPDALLAVSDQVTVNWTTETLTQYAFSGAQQISITSGTPYWIGFFFDDPGVPSFEMSRANTASLTRYSADNYATGPTNPYASDGSSSGALDAYIEYTVGSTSSSPSPSPSPTPSSSISKSPSSSASRSISPSPSAGNTTWASHVQAWIYPGNPACNADEEYADGRRIHILKPEYYTVNSSGVLAQVTEAGSGCNGYTVTNAADVLSYCDNAYFTISSNRANMSALVSDSTKRTNAINTITSFVQTINFKGVELDWEGFGAWTATDYSNYKIFVEDLCTAMHAISKKVIIDGPAIESVAAQANFEFTYADFESSAVDQICVMAYDYQWDYGGGTPVSPNVWMQDTIAWVKAEITDIERIVIGMPAYGYHATTGDYDVIIDTKAQSTAHPGYSTATRDASSYEMTWTNAGISYFYQDEESLYLKRKLIEAEGIKHVSVWHLGGNDWFYGTELSPSASISASPSPSASSSVSKSPSASVSASISPSPSSSVSSSISPSSSVSASVSLSPSSSISSSVSASISPSPSSSVSRSISPSPSPSTGFSPSASVSSSISLSPSASPSPSSSISLSPSVSVSSSVSPSASSSVSRSPSSSPSASQSPSSSVSVSVSSSISPSPSSSVSPSISRSPSSSFSHSPSASVSPSPSSSVSSSISPSPSSGGEGWQGRPLYCWTGSAWDLVDTTG